ncbi:MAG: carbon-nitrogen hydrolase family protein [Clostridiales bacterium]|nr:carbon-nitrogen hydrolase family protein [Candidatus Blautia equi]
MKGRFVVAQMEGTSDPGKNVEKARKVVRWAKEEKKADMVLFPETFLNYVTSEITMEERVKLAQSLDGPFVKKMQEIALQYQTWIVFGMREYAGEKNYNTIVVLDDQGKMVTHYHKTHLYDAFSTKESDEFLAGDELFTPIETPFGRIGLFVCYEARFPEIARKLALEGAQILLMPTAWVQGKRKREQLEILASARALENTVYLLAANLCAGQCTGGSMIIDPFGEILEQAEEEEKCLFAEIDTEDIDRIRNTLPSLRNRRDELYS